MGYSGYISNPRRPAYAGIYPGLVGIGSGGPFASQLEGVTPMNPGGERVGEAKHQLQTRQP